MRLACCVMDANAFETAQIPLVKAVRTEEGTTPSLRGLYPLASMMNHACTPNTRHGYDERQRMVVRAAMHIPAGTEITNSYTSLLWGTTARRYQLAVTKHFLCACSRCSDPQVRTLSELSPTRTSWRCLYFRILCSCGQEGGSRLAALRCLTPSCQGSMFPAEPLDDESMWECELCGCQATGRKAAITQGTLGRLLCIVDSKNIAQMERFLCEHHHVMPSTNQIVVEVKCNLIRSYGHATGYSWTGQSSSGLRRAGPNSFRMHAFESGPGNSITDLGLLWFFPVPPNLPFISLRCFSLGHCKWIPPADGMNHACSFPGVCASNNKNTSAFHWNGDLNLFRHE